MPLLINLLYTNKDTVLINSDSRLQKENFTFFQAHIDVINTHDGLMKLHVQARVQTGSVLTRSVFSTCELIILL